jgi:hypothetical protein
MLDHRSLFDPPRYAVPQRFAFTFVKSAPERVA